MSLNKFVRSSRHGREPVPIPLSEALMFTTLGRGERKGQAVPRWGKNFLKWRVRPVARKLEIPESLITFQMMRRTLGTHLQHHGALKDAQGALRHASIQATGDVYIQTIEASVLNAMTSRTTEILAAWRPRLSVGGISSQQMARSKEKSPEGRKAIEPTWTKLCFRRSYKCLILWWTR